MKRTPLKSRGWPKRRSARMLAPKSAKRIAFEDDLDAITPALLERSHGVCELCSAPAVHRHHRLRRSQGGTNTLDNLLHVCERHHRLIHANPSWSYERGLLIRSQGGSR